MSSKSVLQRDGSEKKYQSPGLAHEVLRRMMQATGVGTQTELALLLDIGKAAVSDAKRRNIVPAEWFLKLCREPHRINPLWLENGQEPVRIPLLSEPPRLAESGAAYGDPRQDSHASVPLARYRLGPDGGLEIVRNQARYSFQASWLLQKGEPGHMKLLRIMGDAMQPSLKDGDLVLVDEGQKDVFEGGIYILSLDGQVVIKRLAKRMGSLLLICENRELYEPQEIPFPSEGLAIVGRVVWLSREL